MQLSYTDYEQADVTFNLWYRLSEELYEKDSETLTAFFKPYVERLIMALCKHCQMDSGTGSSSSTRIVQYNFTFQTNWICLKRARISQTFATGSPS